MDLSTDSDAPVTPVAAGTPEAVRGIPFSFAKRHGVLVEAFTEHGAQVVCRPDAPPEALLEMRRVLAVSMQVRNVNVEEFDALLQQAYEEQSN
ncbi:MAG: hypothetical protein ACRESC_06040, partial [Gammaproteobacteria bacterium]